MSQFTRSILITGGTLGLGFHAATELARQLPNHCIVVASRKDADQSAASINKKLGRNNVQFMPLDLSDLKNVRSFVQSWGEKSLPPISHLLLNAALQFPGETQYTVDGFEATFGISHVGHALLFHLLQPYLADEARIIVTSSGTHDPAQKSGLPDATYNTAEEVAHPPASAQKVSGRFYYSTSKLCNILWTYALHRRLTKLPNKTWTVVAFDPGLMPGTGLARDAGPVLRFLWHSVMPSVIPLLKCLISPNVHTPEESGANLAWVALNDRAKTTSGVYYEMREQIKSSKDSYNEAKQEDLWAWTIKTLAANDKERDDFELVH